MSKVITPEVEVIEHLAGGPGAAKRLSLIEHNGDLYHSGRLFAHIVLEQGCGIGYHVHQGDGKFTTFSKVRECTMTTGRKSP